MYSILIVIFLLIVLFYNTNLFKDLINETSSEEEVQKEYKNKITIAVPINNPKNFYDIFDAYNVNTYPKKDIVYCLEDITDESFERVSKSLGLYSVPYVNGTLEVDVKHKLYFSRKYPSTYYIKYKKSELNSIYNTVTNITDGENIILTTQNTYIDSRSLYYINRNINLGFDFQTGISVATDNLYDFVNERSQLLFPIGTPSTYKLIRQLEKFGYDKTKFTSVGGYDNEFIVVKKKIITANLGFRNDTNLIEEFFSRISIKNEYQGVLDPNIMGVYFQNSEQKLLPLINLDKQNSIKFTRESLLKINSVEQIKINMQFIFKKLMRFCNTYINFLLWLATLVILIYAAVSKVEFPVTCLLVFIISGINLVISNFIFIEQQRRMYFTVDYVSLIEIFSNLFWYTIVIRIYGLYVLIINIFLNIVKGIFKKIRR